MSQKARKKGRTTSGLSAEGRAARSRARRCWSAGLSCIHRPSSGSVRLRVLEKGRPLTYSNISLSIASADLDLIFQIDCSERHAVSRALGRESSCLLHISSDFLSRRNRDSVCHTTRCKVFYERAILYFTLHRLSDFMDINSERASRTSRVIRSSGTPVSLLKI